LDEVCILDPAMSRKILMAFRTRDYGDVLRVFSHSCKFKTVMCVCMCVYVCVCVSVVCVCVCVCV
jgi:hypothetical protein